MTKMINWIDKTWQIYGTSGGRELEMFILHNYMSFMS